MALSALFDKLNLPELGSTLRSYRQASAQHLASSGINSSLLLCDDVLFNTLSGESRRLESAEDFAASAAALAQAARSLLSASAASASVLLLLPSSDFAATPFRLAISGEKLLKSALRLQAPTLFPSYEDKLQLALDGRESEGIALWYPERQADLLYRAFREQGLHLAALMPRALATGGNEQNQLVLDRDASRQTLVELEQGVVKSWLSIRHEDLDDEVFARQWQEQLERRSAEQELLTLDAASWPALRRTLPALETYSFYPAGAVAAGEQQMARRQRRLGAIAAGVVVFLLALPFISNQVRLAWLDREVARYQQLSTEARASQTAVYDMEDEWGAVAEYPRQDVAGILLGLNELIDNSLSSFALEKGVVDITGVAQDPALLIEQLAEQEQFFNVAQSRSSSGGSSSGDRFGIRMNVSEVDFPAYEEAHPEVR